MRVTKYNFETNDTLIVERKNIYGEDIVIFSTLDSDYIARLVTLGDSLVVEHNIPMAETATFPTSNRHDAITYIKSLLSLFSCEDFEEALQHGYKSYTENVSENPYDDELLHAAWERGFSMSKNYFQESEFSCVHTIQNV